MSPETAVRPLALTSRQVEVLRVLHVGVTDKEIGYRLGLGAGTVAVMLSKIRARMVAAGVGVCDGVSVTGVNREQAQGAQGRVTGFSRVQMALWVERGGLLGVVERLGMQDEKVSESGAGVAGSLFGKAGGPAATFVEYDPAKQTPDEALKAARLRELLPVMPPVMLPDDTLRDHVNDLVMQVLAREKLRAQEAWGPDRVTLRDRLAMAAPFPVISEIYGPNPDHTAVNCEFDKVCRLRYLWADAMLKARA